MARVNCSCGHRIEIAGVTREYGAGLICREHEMEYEIFEEGGEND